MGSAMTRLLGSLFGGVQQRIMLVGLDAAGMFFFNEKTNLSRFSLTTFELNWVELLFVCLFCLICLV
jgi:hypothetical protein